MASAREKALEDTLRRLLKALGYVSRRRRRMPFNPERMAQAMADVEICRRQGAQLLKREPDVLHA